MHRLLLVQNALENYLGGIYKQIIICQILINNIDDELLREVVVELNDFLRGVSKGVWVKY